MKFSFSKLLLADALLVVVLAGVGWGLVRFREIIMDEASPERFWYAALVVAGLLAIVLIGILTVRTRIEGMVALRTASLLETQTLFVELYRNSPVPYVLVDYDGTVTYPNHAAKHLFGLTKDGFAGKNFFKLFSVTNTDTHIDRDHVFTRFGNGTFVDSVEVDVFRPDGTIRSCLLSIFPYGNFGERKKGLVTIVDITRQKEVELAKTDFISLASHQLRTPVSAMKWNLELLRGAFPGSLSPTQDEYFQKVTTGMHRLGALVDDLLTAVQLELGHHKVTSTDIELIAFFETIKEQVAARAHEKQQTLTVAASESLATFVSDKFLLQMAIGNLVGNAVKYTPDGGAITCTYQADHDFLTVTVADTGIGITEEAQEKLFQKFFRSDEAKGTAIEGTGLGLYIVRLAATTLGGTITVDSTPNVGSTFSLTVPNPKRGSIL